MPLTLLAGGVFLGIFVLLKIPNGLRIGAMAGAALLDVLFNAAYMPSPTKFVVQVIAGALSGCTMGKSDITYLPQVVKLTLIMVIIFLIQIFCALIAMAVFPQIINLLAMILTGGA